MKKNKNKKLKRLDLIEENGIVSATECTGIMPALPDTDAEVRAVKDIYNIP